MPLLGHVTTGTGKAQECPGTGDENHMLTQMTGLDAFHLVRESEALVRNKHAVTGHKSTSYGCQAMPVKGGKHALLKGQEIFYLSNFMVVC